MKKILSTIVAALVAVSFGAIVFAEEAPYAEHRDAPSGEMRRDEPRRDEVKPMHHKKMKKHHRKTMHKKQIREEDQHQHM